MLRLKSAGMKVRIVHVGRYVHPDYPGDCIVRVEAIDQPGWRREKSLHQLTGRPEEISRQLHRAEGIVPERSGARGVGSHPQGQEPAQPVRDLGGHFRHREAGGIPTVTVPTFTLRELWDRVDHDDPASFLAFVAILLATAGSQRVPPLEDVQRLVDQFAESLDEPMEEAIERILDGLDWLRINKGLCDFTGFTFAAREGRN